MPITEKATRNRTAIFGGTFDPPHIGHMHIFHEVAELTPFDGLLVMPARISNFKQGTEPASFADRIRMVGLLAEDYRASYPDDDLSITVSDWEGMRSGISYTSDTIRHFFDELSFDGKVDFIIGDDHLSKLSGWHDFGYLSSHVRFWCFTRDGEAVNDTDAEVIFMHSSKVHASSTEIRMGDSDGMLTPSVRRYIDEHRLYRA